MKVRVNVEKKILYTHDVFAKLVEGKTIYVNFENMNNNEKSDMFITPCINKHQPEESKICVFYVASNGIFVTEEKFNPNVIDFHLGDRHILDMTVVDEITSIDFNGSEYISSDRKEV